MLFTRDHRFRNWGPYEYVHKILELEATTVLLKNDVISLKEQIVALSAPDVLRAQGTHPLRRVDGVSENKGEWVSEIENPWDLDEFKYLFEDNLPEDE